MNSLPPPSLSPGSPPASPFPALVVADRLVALAPVARRFGYRDARHFREAVAARLDLQPIRSGSRWFLWQSEVDRAFAALPRPMA